MKKNATSTRKTNRKPAASKRKPANKPAEGTITPTTPEVPKGIEKWRLYTPAEMIKIAGDKIPPTFDNVSDRELLEFFNNNVSPTKKMKAFKDRERAEVAVGDLLLALKSNDRKGTVADGTTTPKPKKSGNGSSTGTFGRGRTSEHAGKEIHRVEKYAKENPRKPGTFGHKSFELIPSKGGIVYEDYIAKGGRSNDLAWDLAHGYVVVKAAK